MRRAAPPDARQRSTVDTAADTVFVARAQRHGASRATVVWRNFGELHLRMYPRRNSALFPSATASVTGCTVCVARCPADCGSRATCAPSAAFEGASPRVARADEAALEGRPREHVLRRPLCTPEFEQSLASVREPGLAVGWSCEDAWVPEILRAGCYNIFFRFFVGHRHDQQFTAVPHPDFLVPLNESEAVLPGADDSRGSVAACNVSAASRPACLRRLRCDVLLRGRESTPRRGRGHRAVRVHIRPHSDEARFDPMQLVCRARRARSRAAARASRVTSGARRA